MFLTYDMWIPPIKKKLMKGSYVIEGGQDRIGTPDPFGPALAIERAVGANCVCVGRFLRREVQDEVLEGERAGPVPPVLRAVLPAVQVRSVGDLRQQGRVPLLQGQVHRRRQEEEAQVSLIYLAS
ncbi:peamaclein-like [Iris pallida]|uniref:Peamaclein-like n=1 Tax=Iris pallida TaxID=29817 RepID=A0AAX6H481_IRIPA|nr:peamaclein-like [Iris pallida]